MLKYTIDNATELLMDFSFEGYLNHENIVGSYVASPKGFATPYPFIFVVQTNGKVKLPKNYRGIIVHQIITDFDSDELNEIPINIETSISAEHIDNLLSEITEVDCGCNA